MRALGFVCAASLLVVSGCARPLLPDRAPERIALAVEGDEEVVIPSRWCGSYIIVDVVVNGVGPVSLLLDTGSDTTVFDASLASRFSDAVMDEAEIVRGAEGEEVEVRRQLRVESMRVGGVELGGFDAVMLDLSAISEALGEPVEGVMGFRSFHDVLLSVDYPGRQVRVRRGTLSDNRFDSVLPMRGVRSPSVELTMGDESVYALIDTAGMTCLTLNEWEALPLASGVRPVGTSVTIGGVKVLERGRIGVDVACGPHVFAAPLFSPTSGGPKFGTDMLEQFTVTFDQRSRLVRFDRWGLVDDPITFGAQRGLGIGFDRRVDGWEVLRVFEGGPASLLPGDVVVAIEGEPVGSLGCGRYRELIETCSACALRVDRGVQRFDVEAPVLELVP